MRKQRPCRVCAHGERSTIDEGLRAGLSPRWMARRYSAELNRVQLARHKEWCLKDKGQALGPTGGDDAA